MGVHGKRKVEIRGPEFGSQVDLTISGESRHIDSFLTATFLKAV